MSDPGNQPALTIPDVERIVDIDPVGRRPTLIEASLISAKSIAHTMTGVIQPQINAHSTAITAAQALITAHSTAIASAKTQLDANGTSITAAQGQIGAHGEAIASAKTQLEAHRTAIATIEGHARAQGEALARAQMRLDAQHETLGGVQMHLARLAETTGRYEQAITVALLGEDGHIRRIGRELAVLTERVRCLEEQCGDSNTPARSGAPTDALHEANEALRGHVTAMEAAIHELRERVTASADMVREMREANEALRERVTAMEAAMRELLEQGPQGGGPRPPRQR